MLRIAVMLLACNPVHRIKPPELNPAPIQMGTVESRQLVLIAYQEQFNGEPARSMDAFSLAWKNDPGSSILLLLWGDSAWEQGLVEEAGLAWELYRDSLPADAVEEYQEIEARLQQRTSQQ